jgi:hypothetical protein
MISGPACLWAQDFGGEPDAEVFEKPSYSPWAGRNFPDQVYWGDTHLHTTLSFDAGAFGNRLGPEEAYQFALGEEVTSTGGYRVRLSRPLDFLVVSDHSDNMGLFTRIFESAPEIMSDADGRRIHDDIKAGGQRAVGASVELIDAFSRGVKISDALAVDPGSPAFTATWERIVNAAEEYNDPGVFTAFIGYEWTSLVNTGDNLHRVVIYRGDSSLALRFEPYTTLAPYGSPDPMDLWKWMANYENQSGGQILTLAHNGNLSNGIMFPVRQQYTGRRIDKEYISQRIRWEPLYEATQIKGDGETHPFLSPDDEFADYETWDKGNLNLSVAKTNEMLHRPTAIPPWQPPRKTISSANTRARNPAPNAWNMRWRKWATPNTRAGRLRPPAWLRSGPPITRARLFSTPCGARKCTQPPGRA